MIIDPSKNLHFLRTRVWMNRHENSSVEEQIEIGREPHRGGEMLDFCPPCDLTSRVHARRRTGTPPILLFPQGQHTDQRRGGIMITLSFCVTGLPFTSQCAVTTWIPCVAKACRSSV